MCFKINHEIRKRVEIKDIKNYKSIPKHAFVIDTGMWKDSIPRPILVINKDISHRQLPYVCFNWKLFSSNLCSQSWYLSWQLLNVICKESLLHLY